MWFEEALREVARANGYKPRPKLVPRALFVQMVETHKVTPRTYPHSPSLSSL
jgi:hypothetical protein